MFEVILSFPPKSGPATHTHTHTHAHTHTLSPTCTLFPTTREVGRIYCSPEALALNTHDASHPWFGGFH